ncbi:MAG: hypothetical protein M3O88_01870, partial [Actinomycetota bacterium]|nr:hypothetical protein [Actinomycetota bacterium]
RLSGGSLLRGDGSEPIRLPCPKDRADELAAVRSWLGRNPVTVEEADSPPQEQVAGGAQLHALLGRMRAADDRTTAAS